MLVTNRGPYNTYNGYHQYPAHTGYQDTAAPMEVNNLSNGYYNDGYNGYHDNYNPYQGQQYVDSKRPYSTGFGNAPRRDVNQNTTRNNVHAGNKSNNSSGQWRRGNVNVSALDVTTSFSKPCGSTGMIDCITDKPKDLICNEIQEEDVSISEAFVSLFDESKDNMLDTATLQNDPSTIAPWTTRVMFGKLVSTALLDTGATGKLVSTALLDTGATGDIMRPDIADNLMLERHQCGIPRTLALADRRPSANAMNM
jgi:hypothetical protein